MRSKLLLVAALAAAALVAGCGPRISPTDFTGGARSAAQDVSQWQLANVVVEIPEAMVVQTDGDERYPDSDRLVWWGDPPGDRKAQVKALMAEAVRAGSLDVMTGVRPVVVRLDIVQFHAMTPRARATNVQLGVHEVRFDLTVLDASTGEVLAKEPAVNSDLRAFSGSQAVLAEKAGQGQKIRIQTRVAQVIRAWLTS